VFPRRDWQDGMFDQANGMPVDASDFRTAA
jgi:hypothetical protein